MSIWCVQATSHETGMHVGFRRRARVLYAHATVYSSPSAAARAVESAIKRWPQYNWSAITWSSARRIIERETPC